MRKLKTLLSLLIVTLGLLAYPILGGQVARAEAPNLPTLEEFATSLHTADGLAGLYSDGLFALPIIQQPSGNPGFVSSQPGVVTQFSMAEDYNTTGLLAHNTMAGAEFEHVTVGQILTLVYANGERKIYQVSSIERYQALNPHDTRSDFLSIADENLRLSATELFNRIYAPGNRLILQTCIANQGNFSWGRLFIIAQPVTQLSMPIAAFDPMPSWFVSGGYAAR